MDIYESKNSLSTSKGLQHNYLQTHGHIGDQLISHKNKMFGSLKSKGSTFSRGRNSKQSNESIHRRGKSSIFNAQNGPYAPYAAGSEKSKLN
jgi:hypothetical protein